MHTTVCEAPAPHSHRGVVHNRDAVPARPRLFGGRDKVTSLPSLLAREKTTRTIFLL